MKRIVSIVVLVVLSAGVLVLGGCSNPTVQTRLDPIPVGFTPELNWKSKIVWDEWVRRGDLRVSVFPQTPPPSEPTALFFPFLPTVTLRDNPLDTGTVVAKIFWQEWLCSAPFTILEFQEMHTSYTADYAVAIARQRGAAFAVTGQLTDYVDGGSVSGARVGIKLNIYETATGTLIWSMEQFAFMQKDRNRDYILFHTEMRLPSDPLWMTVAALAQTMKEPVVKWAAQWQVIQEQITSESNAAF